MEIKNEILRQIWEDRYKKGDESIDDNIKRVAKYISSNKDEYLEFKRVMDEGLFFPAGRTMSNAGIGKNLTLNNCFCEGMKVITKRGLINIEDVLVGDYVITEDNTWQRVNEVMTRNYEGDIYKISGNSLYGDILCTPNHRFLTQNSWVRADRLLHDSKRTSPVDRLKVPSLTFNKKYSIVDLSKYIKTDKNTRIKYMDDNKINVEKLCNKNRHNDNINWSTFGYPTNRYIELTPDFRYFIGRWLGDGSITKYKGKKNHSILQIVFNATTERESAIKCRAIGDKAFGFEATWQETNQNVIALRWASEIIGEYFFNEFGEKCDGKHLSNEYIGDIEIAKGLFDADGMLDTHGSGRLTLKNKCLIEWFKDTMYLNGYNTTNISKNKKYEDTYSVGYATSIGSKGFNQLLSKTYHDKRENKITPNALYKDYVSMTNIEIIENTSCKVYNLSVENVHSYTINGVVVHNCFISPMIEDDMENIFDKVKLGALTHKAGGGIGYAFSKIRPRGMETSNDAIASGAVSFMDVFNSQTATIMQGSRRGANMAVLSVYHPDIEEYINAKSYDEGKLVHFNLSVMVDDDFMWAVEDDKPIYLHYPVYDDNGFLIKDESKWKVKKEVRARDIWDMIINKAYTNGEPGIFFDENLNDDNPLSYIERIVCTNPCAEYLGGTVYGDNPTTGEKLDSNEYGGACNLGSLFMHKFVVNPFTKNAKIDTVKLSKTIDVAVRMLDGIIDINNFPNKIYENYQKSFRTIGLGVTGIGDMFTMMNMKYGSKESLKFIDELMEIIALRAYRSSIDLAIEKGSFPLLDKEAFAKCGFIEKHIYTDSTDSWKSIAEDIKKYGIRNGKILSVAPVGTLSLTYGENCSSGLEPIFSLSYDRKVKIGGQSDDNARIIKMQDYAYGEWLKIKDRKDCIVTEDIFVTAMNLDVDDHINVLSKIANHIDMSCSKTINVPTDYSFEKCKDIYTKCWKLGIKGATIFRPNEIRQGVLISETPKKEESKVVNPNENQLPWGYIIKASDDLVGKKRKLVTGCGSLHLQAWGDPDNGNILEVFLSKGSSGGCFGYMNGLSRMISVALRSGCPISEVANQLDSVMGCPSYVTRTITKHDTNKGASCPNAIGRVLLEIQEELWDELGNNEVEVQEDTTVIINPPKESDSFTNEEKQFLAKYGESSFAQRYKKCPICGAELTSGGGCLQCRDCGYSKC